MVIASHVIFTTYGFWLPNDPRGSWSDFVGSWELLRFGKATKTDERRSVARAAHNTDQRIAAKERLKLPPVHFTGKQALAISQAIAEVSSAKGYSFYAFAILPDHVHAVVERHERDAEDIVGHLKFAATRRLLDLRMHPFSENRDRSGRLPTIWTKRSWKVFLDSDSDVERAVRYVRENPTKEGKKEQRWSFVRQ